MPPRFGALIGFSPTADPATTHAFSVGTLGLTLALEDGGRLMAAGVVAEAAPKHNAEYGIYHFYAQGPNGERVEVQRFDELRTLDKTF